MTLFNQNNDEKQVFFANKEKAASLKLRKTAGFWRRVRDSNPRSLSEHDFSSRLSYAHYGGN